MGTQEVISDQDLVSCYIKGNELALETLSIDTKTVCLATLIIY